MPVTQLDVILIMSFVFYVIQVYFEKLVHYPRPVESDPYYQAIYGTGEFSPENMRKKRMAEEQHRMEEDKIHQFEFVEPDVEISSDKEVEDFIKELQSEFKDSEEVTPNELEIIQDSEQLEMKVKDNKLVFDEEGDYLDISELDLPSYQDFPSSSISDEIEGQQQWFVIVVGKEKGYLHVMDSKKKWIYVGEEEADKISINDTLMLTVEVVEGKIKVLDIVIMADVYH